MRWLGRQSITLQLTFLFSAASTIVLLLLGYLIGHSVNQHFVEQDMELLTGKLALATHALEKVRSNADFEVFPQLLGDSLIGHHGLEVIIVTPEGQVLFATHEADFPQALLHISASADALTPLTWTSSNNQPFRGISASVATGIKGTGPAVVAVATDISHHEHFMSSFRITLWSVVVLAAALTGVLGWMGAKRGLAPLNAIAREAELITAHRLHSRLAVDAVPVELCALVGTLNEMLARLESSFKRLSDFSSDLAHELRTPVTNLLTQTQVSLSRSRTSQEYADILASNVEEFERLSRMISDMLFLAKSDNDLVIPSRELVHLDEEVRELLEFYDALAEEKSIHLSSAGTAVVAGDRLMLRRAISNLLSNAIRHAPSGGRVAVVINVSTAGGIRLTVENTGPAIPPEHVLRVFDRFYRVDPSRQRMSDGAGLGLAITRSISRAHGGDAYVSSSAEVTRFTLEFPAVHNNGS